MDGSLLAAPGCGKDSQEGLGANPTDRGRGRKDSHYPLSPRGSKLHGACDRTRLLVDEQGIPLGIEVRGANLHDSRLARCDCLNIGNAFRVGTTCEALIIEAPPAEGVRRFADESHRVKRRENLTTCAWTKGTITPVWKTKCTRC